MAFDKESIIQVLKDTYNEMKNKEEDVPKNFKFYDELSERTRAKFVDQFARTLRDNILAALDTSLFKNASEGFVFTYTSMHCAKYMKDANNSFKTIKETVYEKVEHIEVDPNDSRFCLITYIDGNKKRVLNDKYNVFIVKMLSTVIELYKNKNKPKNAKVKYVLNDQYIDNKEVDIYFNYVNRIYNCLDFNYESKTYNNEAITEILKKYDKEDDYVKSMHLLLEGYDQFVCMAFDMSQKYNGDILEELGSMFEFEDAYETLVFSCLCYIKAYSHHKISSLEYLVDVIINHKNIRDYFKLLTAVSNLFDAMVENNYSFTIDESKIKDKLYSIYITFDGPYEKLGVLEKQAKYKK